MAMMVSVIHSVWGGRLMRRSLLALSMRFCSFSFARRILSRSASVGMRMILSSSSCGGKGVFIMLFFA